MSLGRAGVSLVDAARATKTDFTSRSLEFCLIFPTLVLFQVEPLLPSGKTSRGPRHSHSSTNVFPSPPTCLPGTAVPFGPAHAPSWLPLHFILFLMFFKSECFPSGVKYGHIHFHLSHTWMRMTRLQSSFSQVKSRDHKRASGGTRLVSAAATELCSPRGCRGDTFPAGNSVA